MLMVEETEKQLEMLQEGVMNAPSQAPEDG